MLARAGLSLMVVGEGEERRERKYSNGEINCELTTLKRILNLARQNGELMHLPHVPMLKERKGAYGLLRARADRAHPRTPATGDRTSPAGASRARSSGCSGAIERYNIVSECDLVEAAKKLNACSRSRQPVQPAIQIATGLPRRSRAAAKSVTIRAQ